MNNLKRPRVINHTHVDPRFHRFMDRAMWYFPNRVMRLLSLESYPWNLDSQEENERKILARHGDKSIYGSNIDELPQELEIWLDLEYKELEEYLLRKKLEREEKWRVQRNLMKGQSALRNGKEWLLLNANSILTSEVLTLLDDGFLVLYAYHMNIAVSSSHAKKMKKNFQKILDNIHAELRRRWFPIDQKSIISLCMEVSEEVKKDFMTLSHASMRFSGIRKS